MLDLDRARPRAVQMGALWTAGFQPAFFAAGAPAFQARHGGEGRHPRQALSALPAVGPAVAGMTHGEIEPQ